MWDPFEIIDPVERFAEARAESVAPGIPTAKDGRRISTHQALWPAGVAGFVICTLTLVHAVSPRLEVEPASKLGQQSASATASSRQPGGDPKALVPASSPPAQGAHAIDPKAKAEQGPNVQVQASQEPTVLPDATSALAAESNATPTDPAVPETGEAQWVRTSLAAKAHSAPSVSAPIVKYYPVGTELRVTGRQNGWIQVANPATSEQGWIYEVYLAPSTGPVKGKATLPQQAQSPDTLPQATKADLNLPEESGTSSPDSSAPVVQEPRHYGSNRFHGRPAIVIRLRLPRFWR